MSTNSHLMVMGYKKLSKKVFCFMLVTLSILPLVLLAQEIRQSTPPTPIEECAIIDATSAVDLATAMDVPAGDIISASINTSIDGVGVGTNALGSFFPRQDSTFVVLATGLAETAESPNDSGDTSDTLAGLNNSQGNDMVQLQLILAPPTGATCLAFDAAFYSEEFPEFVGSEFNDAFTAEIGGSDLTISNNQIVAPLNFAFDTEGNLITINTVFGVTGNTGTTFDGATPLLRVISPLEPSAFPQVEVVFTIQDLGDSIFDSAVFLDNFSWLFGIDCDSGAQVDTDGDALLDVWELEGIDVDQDGTIDIDLPAMGADPMHKDIFIEADYMENNGLCILGVCLGGHSHKPTTNALKIVIDAFANAPVTNPDGTTGINIHIDGGSDTIMNPVTGDRWGNSSESNVLTHDDELGTCPVTNGRCSGSYNWSEFDQLKSNNFSVFRRNVFHYVVFGHQLGASRHSGVSRGISASDFIVSLGLYAKMIGDEHQQAGTLMHELGHNLALDHGGGDSDNYKPNYLSVMNYFFQKRGLLINGNFGNFNYSTDDLPDLIESNLDETIGIFNFSPLKVFGTRYYCSETNIIDDDAASKVDWNCDGDENDVTLPPQDINNENGSNQTLAGYDDWGNIHFDGGAVGKFGQVIEFPMETEVNEITVDEDALIITPFAVSVGGPTNLFVLPAMSYMYKFTITNEGENTDNYSMSATSTMGWADLSTLPDNLVVPPGESIDIDIHLQIPAQTATTTKSELTLVATSNTNTLLRDSATAVTIVSNSDGDSDGIPDEVDNCPADPNPDQADSDQDGIGDICETPSNVDNDGDGINDNADNCTEQSNPDQRDTDNDGYGNLCDADLNNDNIVNSQDFGIFKSRFLSADPDADLNGDGKVNSVDFGIAKKSFLKAPGPSGLAP